jgi:hypothetical protein
MTTALYTNTNPQSCHGIQWDVPAERMIQLGLSRECMDWQAKVVCRRGLI